MTNLITTKERLDRLIREASVYLYKPILIAEIMHRDRIVKDIDLADPVSYRKVIVDWREIICPRLVGQTPILHWRYLLQMFDEEVLPPAAIIELAEANHHGSGVVEVYIYNRLMSRFGKVAELRTLLVNAETETFDAKRFIDRFEDMSLRRSIDKAYEIVAYALFETLVKHLKATITISVDGHRRQIPPAFTHFARLVLGVDSAHTEIPQRVRRYCVGTANATDASLDMWANFGLAIQVKHFTLSLDHVGEITDREIAEQIVIVCKEAEIPVIEVVARQTGLKDRIRGFITEADLLDWYDLCKSKKYCSTLGKGLMAELMRQFDIEFPPNNAEAIDAFFSERGYSANILTGQWADETTQ